MNAPVPSDACTTLNIHRLKTITLMAATNMTKFIKTYRDDSGLHLRNPSTGYKQKQVVSMQ